MKKSNIIKVTVFVLVLFITFGFSGISFSDPILAGDDFFASNGSIEITIFDPFYPGGFNEKIVVSSFDPVISQSIDAIIHRDTQVGDNPGTIDTEIVSLDLFGTSTNVGPIHVRVGAGNDTPVMMPSLGQITNVQTQSGSSDPSAFISGMSFFDVFFEIDIIGMGMTFYNMDPKIMGPELITSLPPWGTNYESPGAILIYMQGGPPTPVGTIGSIVHSVPVPEPATFLLFGGGILGMLFYRKRKSG